MEVRHRYRVPALFLVDAEGGNRPQFFVPLVGGQRVKGAHDVAVLGQIRRRGAAGAGIAGGIVRPGVDPVLTGQQRLPGARWVVIGARDDGQRGTV